MRTGWTKLSSLLVVILLLGGSLVFAPKAEALRSVLFPFITTEAGKFTFIMVTNDGSASGFTGVLHFSYATKAVPAGGVVAIDRTAGCAHFDGDGTTTRGDAFIYEANGKVQTDAPSFVLFEGAAPTTSSALPLLASGQAGFLIISEPLGTDAYLYGWETVVDSASGLTWTTSTDFLTAGTAFLGDTDPLGDFSRIDGSLGGFADRKFTSWYPTSIVTPSWFVLPLSSGSTMAPTGGGGIRRAIRTSVDHGIGGVAADTQGAFDLDEQFFSGGKTVTVRCFGFFTLADLLQPGVVAATAGGGQLSVIKTSATVGTDVFDPGAYLLYRVMSTTALGGTKTTINREPTHSPSFCTTPDAACASSL